MTVRVRIDHTTPAAQCSSACKACSQNINLRGTRGCSMSVESAAGSWPCWAGLCSRGGRAGWRGAIGACSGDEEEVGVTACSKDRCASLIPERWKCVFQEKQGSPTARTQGIRTPVLLAPKSIHDAQPGLRGFAARPARLRQ